MAFYGGYSAVFSLAGRLRLPRGAMYAEAVMARRERLMAPTQGRYYYLLLHAVRPGPSAAAQLTAVMLPVIQLVCRCARWELWLCEGGGRCARPGPTFCAHTLCHVCCLVLAHSALPRPPRAG